MSKKGFVAFDDRNIGLHVAIAALANMAHGPTTVVVPGMQMGVANLTIAFNCPKGCRHEWKAANVNGRFGFVTEISEDAARNGGGEQLALPLEPPTEPPAEGGGGQVSGS